MSLHEIALMLDISKMKHGVQIMHHLRQVFRILNKYMSKMYNRVLLQYDKKGFSLEASPISDTQLGMAISSIKPVG